MQWHDRPMLYKPMAKARGLRQGSAREQIAIMLGPANTWPKNPVLQTSYRILQGEGDWTADGRPYYNVWPSVITPFSRLSLDKISCQDLHLPLPGLLVRFGAGHELTAEGCTSKAFSFLVSSWIYLDKRSPDSYELLDAGHTCLADLAGHTQYWGISIWCGDMGAVRTFEEAPGETFQLPHVVDVVLTMAPGCSVEAALAAGIEDYYSGFSSVQESAKAADRTLLSACLRLLCALCLLNDNPDLIEPEPLEKDREKWEATHDLSLIERAHRKDKKVWNVGRHIETAPGFRRPHFAVRWMGRGPNVEKKPVLRPIKGCLVRRGALLEIPTGYLDDEEVPVGA